MGSDLSFLVLNGLKTSILTFFASYYSFSSGRAYCYESETDFPQSITTFHNKHSYTGYLIVGTVATVTCDYLYGHSGGDLELVCEGPGNWIGNQTVCKCKFNLSFIRFLSVFYFIRAPSSE